MKNKDIEVFLERVKGKLAQSSIANEGIKDAGHRLARSAVLVPLTFHENQIKLIFTKRSFKLAHHQGQVSFPGGLFEPGDKDITDTALRETCEEINIQRDQIHLLGLMAPFDSQTGYFIHPVVGFIHDLNNLRGNETEVERIFCIPYDWLAHPARSVLSDYRTPQGQTRRVWLFDQYEGETLWGITAKITRDFIGLLEN